MSISGELNIGVTTEALVEQASQVRTASQELEDAFARIRELMEGTSHYWKGEAADAHREGYRKEQSSIEQIVARYREHVADLEKMAGVYQEAESRSADLANELPTSNI
ncbi:MAG: WXG100 family type VII secretion target [Oscillospiraceae bacterium]|nr:WXG100 family type VII secretion target [Oscillospiraceae bacterium]